jgi:hypothetical protein
MDISAWLRDLGLERYADSFEANAIDSEVLAEDSDGGYLLLTGNPVGTGAGVLAGGEHPGRPARVRYY